MLIEASESWVRVSRALTSSAEATTPTLSQRDGEKRLVQQPRGATRAPSGSLRAPTLRRRQPRCDTSSVRRTAKHHGQLLAAPARHGM